MSFSKTEETIEEFEKLSCTMVPEIQQHTKTRPNCRNETKWNCISDWVLNEQGEKVGLYIVYKNATNLKFSFDSANHVVIP